MTCSPGRLIHGWSRRSVGYWTTPTSGTLLPRFSVGSTCTPRSKPSCSATWTATPMLWCQDDRTALQVACAFSRPLPRHTQGSSSQPSARVAGVKWFSTAGAPTATESAAPAISPIGLSPAGVAAASGQSAAATPRMAWSARRASGMIRRVARNAPSAAGSTP